MTVLIRFSRCALLRRMRRNKASGSATSEYANAKMVIGQSPCCGLHSFKLIRNTINPVNAIADSPNTKGVTGVPPVLFW